jgi:2-oxoglutarate ferredoxin oxidoreductase subunit gamma
MHSEIRIAGFGGQGVILAGMIIGKAGVIFEGREATLIQSFGPEARGSACSAQVTVSDERVLYPYVTNPDILIVMSQDAYSKFQRGIKPGGILIYESDLVKFDKPREDVKVYGIPATRFAEELGAKITLNIVMVGFFTAITGVIGYESAREAIRVSVPSHTIDVNLKAFEKGYQYGKSVIS